eukprot:2148249-Rhodomonas_salina.1
MNVHERGGGQFADVRKQGPGQHDHRWTLYYESLSTMILAPCSQPGPPAATSESLLRWHAVASHPWQPEDQ